MKTTPNQKKEDPMHPENSKFNFKCKLKTPLPRAKVSKMIYKLENPECSPLPLTNNSKNNLISKTFTYSSKTEIEDSKNPHDRQAHQWETRAGKSSQSGTRDKMNRMPWEQPFQN